MELDQLYREVIDCIKAPAPFKEDSAEASRAKKDAISSEKITELINGVLARKKEPTNFLEQLDWHDECTQKKEGEVIGRFEIRKNIDFYSAFHSVNTHASKIEIAQLSLQLEDFNEIVKSCYEQYKSATKSFFEAKGFLFGLYFVLLLLSFSIAMIILDPSKKKGNMAYVYACIGCGLILFLLLTLCAFKSWYAIRRKREYNIVYYKTMIAVYLKCKNILTFEATPFKLRANYACNGFEVIKEVSDFPSRTSIVRDRVFTIVVEEDTHNELTVMEVNDSSVLESNEVYTKVNTTERT